MTRPQTAFAVITCVPTTLAAAFLLGTAASEVMDLILGVPA